MPYDTRQHSRVMVRKHALVLVTVIAVVPVVRAHHAPPISRCITRYLACQTRLHRGSTLRHARRQRHGWRIHL
jgi:hypothetical protein